MISLTETIKAWADWCIHAGGYWGAGGLMALESMIAPGPSEVVMPPVGMAVRRGDMLWPWAILATSLGSLVGSLISYYLGYFGGKPLVMKVGRFLLINEEHLDLTHRWFDRHGGATVFVCRFVPVVRHFISIPAGIAKMNLLRFCIYTLVGATIWNAALLLAGYYIEDIWEQKILPWRGKIDVAIVVLLVVAVAAWYWIHLRKPKVRQEERV
jgi:membrane protein DedA with SNARE-associated domain